MAPRTSPHRRPFRALLTIFATLVAVIAQQAVTQSPASAAATWNDGTPAYSTIWNCYSLMPGSTPYQELGLGVGLGASVDWPAQQPVPGQMFLLKVIMTSVGRTCSGNYVDVQFKLPTGVSTAITGTDKIKCFLRGQPVPVNQCPTALTAGSESGYLKLPAPPATMSEHPTLWPVPYAQTVEFHVPVRATQAMSNAQVLGRMDVLDGNARPMLRPTAGINVFAPATTPPGAPTGATATAGVNKATVTWSAPSNPGSSAITGYVVTPYRDGVAQSSVSASASARTLDVNGLDAGVSYTFRVAAVSAAGTGAQSGASNAVVPTAPVVTAPPGAPTGVTA
ncbi:MAG: fibronectin type III domain-containing protein, partial [Aquihabitans sp.]